LGSGVSFKFIHTSHKYNRVLHEIMDVA